MGHLGRKGHMDDRHMGSEHMWTCAGSCAIGHMGNGKHSQRGIMVNTLDRDGAPWEMGHMANGAHRQWGTWV